jgi:glycosyltransferase involved in cell wall biosynthesis
LLSLVIPVYKNEASIPQLLDAIEQMHNKLVNELETVFVIDGSPDRSYEILRDALPKRPFLSKLILLSRNFGSFSAIRVGLQHGSGDRFAVMAADLQEPPELVLEMNRVLQDEPIDVVVGVREARNDPLLSRLPAQLFWSMYRRFVVPDMPEGGVDMFACNRQFRNTLLTLDERHSSLIAQIFWLGFRRKCVSYVRQERQHGKSAWTFRKKLNYMMDSIFAFTDLPIRLLIRVGGGTALLATLLGICVAIAKMFGWIAVPGYAMTIIAIVLLGASNLFALGVVGSYAWRTYENTKGRPLAIPVFIENFAGR